MIVELDEAANIVRWPELPKLYSHYGSRGILLHTYLQSWTQGTEAWGEYGMRSMWSAATIRVLGAGVADEKFLSEFSSLIGDHEDWALQSVYLARAGSGSAPSRCGVNARSPCRTWCRCPGTGRSCSRPDPGRW